MARKNRLDEMKKDLQRAQTDARTQVMAVVGATDLAIEKVREAQERLLAAAKDVDITNLDKDMKSVRERLEKLQEELADRVSRTAKDMRGAPANAIGHGIELATNLQSQVEELAERGEELVKRIRRQQPNADLKSQVKSTVAAGKGAVTTARKAAVETERAAVATLKTASREARTVATKVAETVEKDAKDTVTTVRESAARTRAAARKTADTAEAGAKKTTARARATKTGVRKTATRATRATKAAAAKVGD